MDLIYVMLILLVCLIIIGILCYLLINKNQSKETITEEKSENSMVVKDEQPSYFPAIQIIENNDIIPSNKALIKNEVVKSTLSKIDNVAPKTFNIATVNVKNEYRTRLEEITKQINNLLNNIASGIAVEEKKKKINELEKEKETIEEKLIEAEQKEKDNKVSLNMIKNLKATWFDMDFDEQRRIIEHLIDKVIVNDNEINIYYNIY